MKVPLSWLREWVDLTLPLDELVHRLNMSGTEVEDVIQVGADWERIYVAEIVQLDRHPNADNLFVARLDVGPRGLVTIVTGATNLSVGARVPLVEPGGRLPGGRAIEAATLRGIASEGMLCSGDELGVSPDRSGIYVLGTNGQGVGTGSGDGRGAGIAGTGQGQLGQPLADLLADTVLDLYITPNRPDCMSVFGIAREVHALTGAPLRRVQTRRPTGPRPASDFIRVEIHDPDLCRRFTAAYVADVTIGPSPLWLQQRLYLADVRPISNVVDATNYTMLELGQPQHAFDADRLGPVVVARRARDGERLVTLDNVERALDPEMLVIADAEKAVGIAGIMGGGPTEVSDATRTVLLETANFLPATIRRTSASVELKSEASRRYERGIDPDLAMIAAERTVQLIADLTGGTPAAGIVDEYPGRAEPRRIDVSERDVSALLGHTYSRAQVSSILTSLDFAVEAQGERLLVTVPGHRPDVDGKADLAEEVARIEGYDALPVTLPTGAPPEPKVDPLRAAGDAAKDVLVGCGLHEVMTYSLVAPTSAARLRPDDGTSAPTAAPDSSPAPSAATPMAPASDPAADDPIPVFNAMSADLSVLRTTLLPSLLETTRASLRHRDRVAIFELARVYLPPLQPLPTERPRLGIVLTGPFAPVAWHQPARPADFFDLKGMIEAVLGRFSLQLEVAPTTADGFHPGRCAEIRAAAAGGLTVPLGVVGQLHPAVAARFDLEGRTVVMAELDFDTLVENAQSQPEVAPLARFPGLDRDLALVLDRAAAHADVAAALRTAGGDLLEGVTLFDVYEGPQVPAGKKSLAYTLRFRAPDRTLTDTEADAAVELLVAEVGARFGATVRGG